mgnify:CR=1 FL=1
MKIAIVTDSNSGITQASAGANELAAGAKNLSDISAATLQFCCILVQVCRNNKFHEVKGQLEDADFFR